MGRKLRRRGKPGRKAAQLDRSPFELTVESLGARGDGIARHRGQPVYVFDALPGERVSLRPETKEGQGLRARRLALLEPSAERVAAPCPQFGDCGGCDLQHLAEAGYRNWKRDLLVTALQRRGFGEAKELVQPLQAVEPGRRRRATWALRKDGRAVRLGFRARASHRIVDQQDCLQLLPELRDLARALRPLFADLAVQGQEGQARATLCDNGIDLVLSLEREPDLAQREELAAFADRHNLARLSIGTSEGEQQLLAERRRPSLRFGDIVVAPPPDGFLQPSKEGEALLVRSVLDAIPNDLKTVADLYAGCGTFALPLLARGQRVLAVEGHRPSLGALETAARSSGLGTQLTSEVRDLERRPLARETLSALDALVFDPPRAGAAALSAALAEAGPPLVVAVSCSPQSFARDARTLVEGGYRLESALPVDQFPWSHHLEIVAVFRRS